MYAERLERLRQELRGAGVDCLALVPGSNLRYLTGVNFMLLERPFLLFVLADAGRDPVVVLPHLEAPAWQAEVPWHASLLPWRDEEGPEGAMRRAAALLSESRSIGVEHLRMRVQEYELVRRWLPHADLQQGDPLISALRIRKDQAELAALERAVRVVERALADVVARVEVGASERDLVGRLMNEVLRHGGEDISLEPLVLSGPRSAMPHGGTSERRVATGDLLLFDFVTTVEGYYADITRTFVVGAPAAKTREIYEVVRAANRAAREAVRPGIPCSAIDQAARRVIEGAGYGEYFLHRTGHGLGLDVHEGPEIQAGNEQLLEPGMVFTIEPGVYLEGWGGIRIEDDVVVTEDGCRSLTTYDRALRVLGSAYTPV